MRRLSLGRSRHFVWAPRTRHHVVVWLFRNRYRQFEFTSLRHPVFDIRESRPLESSSGVWTNFSLRRDDTVSFA